MPFLLIIPSIDIKYGTTVRVVQGIPELNCSEYGNDPVEMARIWRAENAKMLHVVDFDGFSAHSDRNYAIIKEICSSVIIPVEFAGGIRNLVDADNIFSFGVSRAVISTVVFEDWDEFCRILDKYGPKKIVVALDVVDNELVIKGRKVKTGIHPLELAYKLKTTGIERLIVTDVKRNGMLSGPNIELSRKVAETTGLKVTHSGGIRNKDELMDLQSLIPVGVDSVIVGRALYENRFPCQKLWRVAEKEIFS
ncbi:MAG: 1-(5-phosphoribosyl)-5-[(5-phosphoribosylamino)methylideneamino] imidazole-4-carboxamide isomerase [Ignavibacteriales bacterium]|nr:1-(5-phosphoribosyl)-5-[(5-phosphoribosylamino)methylideneamino] imidazole-4-carboxamide isomerase [Ignavibacteriaceae bacterium]MCK6613216.1 1-(5-phosphoribosyl)-5-[(5-phosphoribosylamino)methylideneamino] imidazole-4-carboxamide isomerase [Ignavibacteriaceae bacterium]QOJ28926.1 MAG: 1-(5-phosphoribosyl)-5-[(5-phosphoribosylamino)methylideneamino] imidazole-4-carboxamide isomerase [Ignavibacteriales bacterium]